MSDRRRAEAADGRRRAPARDARARNDVTHDLRLGEKGGAAVGPTRRGKGTNIMAIVDRHGLPVAVHVASASPYEPHLVPATLDARFFTDLSTRLIGDRGYDSDRLDDILMTTYGIEMIAAHRRGRGAPKMADRCVASTDAGRSGASSRGSTTRAEQSLGGNITSTTFSA